MALLHCLSISGATGFGLGCSILRPSKGQILLESVILIDVESRTGERMNVRIHRYLPALFLVFFALAASAFAVKYKTDVDKSASFEKFKTFTIKPGVLMANEYRERADKIILDGIRSELAARGLKEVPESGDLTIMYLGGPIGLAGGGGNYTTNAVFDATWDIPYGWRGVVSTSAVDAALLIEVADSSTKHKVWRCLAQGAMLNRDKPDKAAEKLVGIVKKSFQNFPIKAQKTK
jgi:hypothetical protein